MSDFREKPAEAFEERSVHSAPEGGVIAELSQGTEAALESIAMEHRVPLAKIKGVLCLAEWSDGGIRFAGEGFNFFRWLGLSTDTATQATREWAQANSHDWNRDSHPR